MGFFDRIGKIVNGFYGAGQAPFGLVKDLGESLTGTTNDPELDGFFHALVGQTMKRGADVIGGIMGPQGGIGSAISGLPDWSRRPGRMMTKPVMDEDQWVYSHAIAHPLATVAIVGAMGQSELWKQQTGDSTWGVPFDVSSWQKAWDMTQKESPGQAVADNWYFAMLPDITGENDKFDILNKGEHNKWQGSDWYNIISGVTDAALRWKDDPATWAGEGIGAGVARLKAPITSGVEEGARAAAEYTSMGHTLEEAQKYGKSVAVQAQMGQIKEYLASRKYDRFSAAVANIKSQFPSVNRQAAEIANMFPKSPARFDIGAQLAQASGPELEQQAMRVAMGDNAAIQEVAQVDKALAERQRYPWEQQSMLHDPAYTPDYHESTAYRPDSLWPEADIDAQKAAFDANQRMQRITASLQNEPRVGIVGQAKRAIKTTELYQQSPWMRPVRVFFNQAPTNLVDVGDINWINQVQNSLRRAGLSYDEQMEWVGKLANAPVEQRIPLVQEAEADGIKRVAEAHGVHPDDVEKISLGAKEYQRTAMKVVEGATPAENAPGYVKLHIPGDEMDEVVIKAPTALPNAYPMTDFRELGKSLETQRFGDGLKMSQDAIDWTMKAWRTGVLLRPAWPIRIMGEHGLAMTAKMRAMAHGSEYLLSTMKDYAPWKQGLKNYFHDASEQLNYKWGGTTGAIFGGVVAGPIGVPIGIAAGLGLQAIGKSLEEAPYKQFLVNGALVHGAFGNALDKDTLYRNLVSSRKDMEYAFGRHLPDPRQVTTLGPESDRASVQPGHSMYPEKWEQLINEELMHDPLVRTILMHKYGPELAQGDPVFAKWLDEHAYVPAGMTHRAQYQGLPFGASTPTYQTKSGEFKLVDTTRDVVDPVEAGQQWLEHTPEGRAHALKNPVQAKDSHKWVATVDQTLHDYVADDPYIVRRMLTSTMPEPFPETAPLSDILKTNSENPLIIDPLKKLANREQQFKHLPPEAKSYLYNSREINLPFARSEFLPEGTKSGDVVQFHGQVFEKKEAAAEHYMSYPGKTTRSGYEPIMFHIDHGSHGVYIPENEQAMLHGRYSVREMHEEVIGKHPDGTDRTVKVAELRPIGQPLSKAVEEANQHYDYFAGQHAVTYDDLVAATSKRVVNDVPPGFITGPHEFEGSSYPSGEFYHATTNVPGVVERGLMSHGELLDTNAPGAGIGLGGHDVQDTNKVSLALSQPVAQRISNNLQLAAQASREASVSHVIQRLDEINGGALSRNLDEIVKKMHRGGDEHDYRMGQLPDALESGKVIPNETEPVTLPNGTTMSFGGKWQQVPTKLPRLRLNNRYAKIDSLDKLATALEQAGYSPLDAMKYVDAVMADTVPGYQWVGLYNKAEDYKMIDPAHVGVVKVAVRKDAGIQHGQDLGEMAYSPRDVRVISAANETRESDIQAHLQRAYDLEPGPLPEDATNLLPYAPGALAHIPDPVPGAERIRMNIPVDKIASGQEGVNPEIIAEYIRKGGGHVEAEKVGDHYLVMDGNHRVNAAIAKGEKTVPADVIDHGDVPEAEKAIKQAIKENPKYPKPLPPHQTNGYPETAAMPVVHPEFAKQALGKARAIKGAEGVIQNLYKVWGQLPLDDLINNQFFARIYRGEMERKVFGIDTSQMSTGYMAHLEEGARQYALGEMRDLMYDFANRSEFAEMMRVAMPFFPAWQQTIERWAGIAMDNPAFINRARLVLGAPSKMGATWKDPDTGEEYVRFRIPSLGRDIVNHGFLKGALDDQGYIKFQTKGLSLAGEGLPGFGPWVDVALSPFVKQHPELADSLKVIYPYGVPDNIVQTFLPPNLQRLAAINDTDGRSFRSAYNRIIVTRLVKMHTGELPRLDLANADNRAKFLADAQHEASQFMSLRLVVGAFSPAALQYDSPYQPFMDILRNLQKQDPVTAQDKFLDEFGDEYFALTQSFTKLNNGIPASLQGQAEYEKYRNLIDRFPDLGALITGTEGGGSPTQFSAAVYQKQLHTPIRPGSDVMQRSPLSPEEIVQQSDARLGWVKFTRAMDLLDGELAAIGAPNYNVKSAGMLRIMKDQFINIIGKDHPAWFQEYAQRDEAKWQNTIDAMHVIAHDPRLAQRPDIAMLNQYLNIRQLIVSQLAIRQSHGIDAESNADLKSVFDTTIQAMKNGPDGLAFSSLFNRWLASDPLTQPGIDTVGAAA